MRSTVMTMLVAAGCNSSKPEPPPRKTAPVIVEPPPRCVDVRVEIDAQGFNLAGTGTDIKIARSDGELALDAFATAVEGCRGGAAVIAWNREAVYPELVDTMDILREHEIDARLEAPDLGFERQVKIRAPAPARANAAPRGLGLGLGTAIAAPIILVTTASIELHAPGLDQKLAGGPTLDDAAARSLYDGLLTYRRDGGGAASYIVIQADPTTPPLTAYRAAGAGEAAGFDVRLVVD